MRENIKKKFQEGKLVLVDKIMGLDASWRKEKKKVDDLRAERNKISEKINQLMKAGKKSAAKSLVAEAKTIPKKIEKIEVKVRKMANEIKMMMMNRGQRFAGISGI